MTDKAIDLTLGEFHAAEDLPYAPAIGCALRAGQSVTCPAYVAKALGLRPGPAPVAASPSFEPAVEAMPDPEPVEVDSDPADDKPRRNPRRGAKE